MYIIKIAWDFPILVLAKPYFSLVKLLLAGRVIESTFSTFITEGDA